MDGEDRLRPRRHVDTLGVDVHRLRVDVDQHRPEPGERDDVGGRGERVRGYEHLVPGLQSEREYGKVEGGGPRRDRDRVRDVARARNLLLELHDARSHRQHAALEHGGDRVELGAADVRKR